MTGKIRQKWATYAIVAGGIIVAGSIHMQVAAQTAPPIEAAPQLVQQAQTLHLPIQVFSQIDTSPIQ
ncbi:MAG: hypothetical protein ACYDBH_16700, partial [Acidobacteriaceae bacterium]